MATVYIDTSVAINEAFFKSAYAEPFLKACAMLQYAVVVPEIVVDELKGNFPKKLAVKAGALHKAGKEVAKLIETEPSSISIENEAHKFDAWIDDLLVEYGVIVAPYPEIPPKELIEQSYAANKPFKSSGEGHKDYLVWKTILGHALGQSSSAPYLFLTNNTKDFCEEDENGSFVLHPDLLAQIADTNLHPRVYTSIKDAFEKELAPNLEGISLNEIPNLGAQSIEELVEDLIIDNLTDYSLYGLDGVPFSNEITIAGASLNSIDSITLKSVNDQIVIKVTGQADVDVDGFIDKSEYYMADDEGANIHVVDGNWNDHVMHVSSSIVTPFDLTIFYSLSTKEVTGGEVTLPNEIEDEWPYK